MHKNLLFLLILAICITANAQTTQNVKFPKGVTKITFKETVTGFRYIDYVFSVKTTQYFSAKLAGGKAQMIIFEPNGENMPDAAGITEITSQVDVSGNYKIRVLMSRNEARRKNARSAFTLVLEVADLK